LVTSKSHLWRPGPVASVPTFKCCSLMLTVFVANSCRAELWRCARLPGDRRETSHPRRTEKGWTGANEPGVDIKTLLCQLAEYYCVPRARGPGRKVVGPRAHRPDAPGPVVDEQRLRAISCDGRADQLAALALFDPLARVKLLTEIAKEWDLQRELPDPEWMLRDWVERYPDEHSLLSALPALCQFLLGVGTDFEQAKRFNHTCHGLTSVLLRLAERHPTQVAPLQDLILKLKPEPVIDPWSFEGQSFWYFSQIVAAVAPVLFEHGTLSESGAQSLVRRYPRLAEARPDLTRWHHWVKDAEWGVIYSLGKQDRRASPPSGGVQRVLALCSQSNILRDLLFRTLPVPDAQDQKNLSLLGSLSEENALQISVRAPAWAPLLEEALHWPGLAALTRLLAIVQDPFCDWQAQMKGFASWRDSTDLASLRHQLAQLPPARVKLIKTLYQHYQGWYWADALLGKSAQAIQKDVHHGRSRGFLALALVPRHPHLRAYVSAVESFLAILPSRSEPVRLKGLELAHFALGWLDPDGILKGDWDSLHSELVKQLKGG